MQVRPVIIGFACLRICAGVFFYTKLTLPLSDVALSNQDAVELDGDVLESLPNTQFRVKLDAGQEVIAHLSGRMRVNHIRVMPGDRVRVAMSPYDLSKGRIILRLQ